MAAREALLIEACPFPYIIRKKAQKNLLQNACESKILISANCITLAEK
jgi:hypothetical protein